MALQSGFPYRDLIVLTVFSVVLATLAIQGLTLKPLLRALNLHDDDPVGRELATARESVFRAAVASVADNHSPDAERVRQQFSARISSHKAGHDTGAAPRSSHAE